MLTRSLQNALQRLFVGWMPGWPWPAERGAALGMGAIAPGSMIPAQRRA